MCGPEGRHAYHGCGCGAPDTVHHGSCGCHCGPSSYEDHGFRRRYATREERIAELERYLEGLQAEAQAVQERLDEMRGTRAGQE